MGMKQYKVGKSWEDEVMEYYSNKGYSTIKLSTDIDGTVFDIIALKNNRAICIECKHSKTDKLYYRSCGLERKRDEIDNFCDKGNPIMIFVKFDADLNNGYVIDWQYAKLLFKTKKFITKEDCVKVEMNK